MSLHGIIEEGRTTFRRTEDRHFCSQHARDSVRLKLIEEACRGLPGIKAKVNIGIGVVICAFCLATVLFSSVDSFKVEAVAAQQKHEKAISKEQLELKKRIVAIEETGNKTATNVAVVSSQLNDLREELKTDRAEMLIYLRKN